MNIYEITFLLGTYLSLGVNSWLRAVLHRFSQEPLEGRGRVFFTGQQMEVPGEFWCDLFIIHLSSKDLCIYDYLCIYLSSYLFTYLSIHPSIQTTIF